MAYERFRQLGLRDEFSLNLSKICTEKNLNHNDIDQRAVEALCDLDDDVCHYVIEQYAKSDLLHVKNKSAYLCGVIRSSQQRFKRTPRNPGISSTKTNGSERNYRSAGPNEENIKNIAQKTGYSLEIVGGMRKYGGPPPGWEGKAPGDLDENVCCRVSITNLSSDIYEDTLVPLCEKFGEIYEMRINYDLNTNCSKGTVIITFVCQEEAKEFTKLMNGHYIGDRKAVVKLLKNGNKISITDLPKNKSSYDIQTELSLHIKGIKSVYRENDKNNLNTWIVEFENSHDAFLAKNVLSYDQISLFDEAYFDVDWYESLCNSKNEITTKNTNKVVFVSGIKESTSERLLWDIFSPIGIIHSIRKVRDFAFVEYVSAEDASAAIDQCSGKCIDGCIIELNYARPPVSSDKHKSDNYRSKSKHSRSDDKYDNYSSSSSHYHEYSDRDRYSHKGGYYSPNYQDDYYPHYQDYHPSHSQNQSPPYSYNRGHQYENNRYDGGYKKYSNAPNYCNDKYSGY